jgi:hypothetical protein
VLAFGGTSDEFLVRLTIFVAAGALTVCDHVTPVLALGMLRPDQITRSRS